MYTQQQLQQAWKTEENALGKRRLQRRILEASFRYITDSFPPDEGSYLESFILGEPCVFVTTDCVEPGYIAKIDLKKRWLHIYSFVQKKIIQVPEHEISRLSDVHKARGFKSNSWQKIAERFVDGITAQSIKTKSPEEGDKPYHYLRIYSVGHLYIPVPKDVIIGLMVEMFESTRREKLTHCTALTAKASGASALGRNFIKNLDKFALAENCDAPRPATQLLWEHYVEI